VYQFENSILLFHRNCKREGRRKRRERRQRREGGLNIRLSRRARKEEFFSTHDFP